MKDSDNNLRSANLATNWKLGLAVLGIVAASVAMDAAAGTLSFSDDNRDCYYCAHVGNNGVCNENNQTHSVHCAVGNHAICSIDSQGNFEGGTCGPDSLNPF